MGPRRFRGAAVDLPLGLDVRPEPSPERLALAVLGDNQCRHRPSATQRRAVAGATARRVGAQGVKRDGGCRATHGHRAAALHEQVRVVA